MEISIYKQTGNKMIVCKKSITGKKYYAVVWRTETQTWAYNYFSKAGGFWASNTGDSGIDYVADWVSLPTALKRFKELNS